MIIKNTTQTRNYSLTSNIKILNRASSIEHRASKKGFTLVEILVALTIFSIISLSLGATFIQGARIWQRAKNENFLKNDVLLNMEIISADLRECIDSRLTGFSSRKQTLTFACLKNESVMVVNYSFIPLQNKLLRKEALMQDVEEGRINYTKEQILAKIMDDFALEFFYFDKDNEIYSWKDYWNEEEGLPIAVKIQIKVNDEVFTKTVFIPVS